MKLIHQDETINTLKFAQRAKKIKTKAVTNINVNQRKINIKKIKNILFLLISK